ncbi:hypothetical protein NEUTE2DRAFT_161248 [Neurospora tetrasperma FGSC 2509]|nr:hypothetical protein NEUTE2DRAFT_161248 [Neurospora tetrasperma FGSC 2509]
MSSATGISALARIINLDLVSNADMRGNNNNIDDGCFSNDDDITIDMDSASFDTSFNVIIGMIVIATLTGSTLLTAFSTFIIIMALRITTPETNLTQKVTASKDANMPTATPNLDSHIDNEPSTLIVPVDEKVRVYHHARPTVDIVEVTSHATTSANDTKSTNNDNDYFGGLASDIFDFHSLQKYLEEDQMWLAHMPPANPSITSGPKPAFIVKTNKIVGSARPARKTTRTRLPFGKLSIIYEEDEEDEEDIEHPRSSSDEGDNSFDSLADEEDFTDSDEDIIAFAKKVNRLCDELDKVERFSEPVEHIIALGQDIEATFQRWDEEDLEMFSDSEDDAIALAKQIEVDTRPSPPDSPTPQIPEGTGARFTESGFLIETPDNSPAQKTAIVSSAQTPKGPLPRTPIAPHARNIFASPVGESFQHTRKVSNETNTTEETNDTADTQTSNPTAGSPTTVYSSPDNVHEYQAMTGFTVCLSAKKGTGITFDPIAQSGDDIHYDRRFLKDQTPSPSPARCRSPSSITSASSSGSEDMSTPYDYTHHSDDLEILAVLKRPGGASYAKMSCGNWYFLNDDGTLDELNWREYEELIEFIVGDVASLPSKLHQESIRHEVHTQEEELPLPWVPWDDEPEILPEVNVDEELPLPWVPWDEQETMNPKTEPTLKDKNEECTTKNITTKDITEPDNKNFTAEVAEIIINSDQPDEKWYKAEEMPPRWFVMEHIRCPGDEISYYAEYVRGSDDRWYFRLDGPEYRPLDARELRWFLNWRASTRPLTYIVKLDEDEFF